MTKPVLKTVLLLSILALATACSPEIGSKEWCEDLKARDKGEWTLQETADFARHCVI